MKDRKRERDRQTPETWTSRAACDAWARWMIIDPLCGQWERSVSDSTVHRRAERREEGQAEVFPLMPEKVSTWLLALLTAFISLRTNANYVSPFRTLSEFVPKTGEGEILLGDPNKWSEFIWIDFHFTFRTAVYFRTTWGSLNVCFVLTI